MVDTDVKAPLRVLHVIDNLKLGGTQHLLLKSLRTLAARGVDSEVCVINAQDRTYMWDWLPERIIYLGRHCDYRFPCQVYSCAQELRKIIQQRSPDIVHSYLWLSDILTGIANADSECGHVSHVVDCREWLKSRRLKDRIRQSITKWALRRTDIRFVAVSNAARSFAIEALQLDPSQIRVAYNAVDPNEMAHISASPFASRARQKPVLGMVSRLEPEKGHLYLFEALANLNALGQKFQLHVAGEGTYQSQLVEQANELGISDQIRFEGRIERVMNMLEYIDIFVVPSIHSEGLPTTILEAMSAGRVVLATDVGGAAEVIRHEQDGLVVPPRDASALAEAIQFLAKRPDVVETMAISARSYVRDHFSVDRMVDEIEHEYLSIHKSRLEARRIQFIRG